MQLGFSQRDSQQLALFPLASEGPSQSGQFGDLPGLILSCLPAVKEVPARMFHYQKKLLHDSNFLS